MALMSPRSSASGSGDAGMRTGSAHSLPRQTGFQVRYDSARVIPGGFANTRPSKRPLHGARRDRLTAHCERGVGAQDLPLELRERLMRLQLAFQDLVEITVRADTPGAFRKCS